MASTQHVLWKPSSDNDGNLVILFPYSTGGVTIRDAESGEVLSQGRPGGPSNGFQDTVRFDRPGQSFNNVIVETADGQSFFIDNGGTRRESIETAASGETPSAPTGFEASGASGGSGVPGGFAPGNFGGLGFFPAYLGGMFPDPSLISYDPISKAPYQFTDPAEFASTYGPEIRNQLRQNFDLSKQFGLEQIDTELEGLLRFVPKAAELARSQIGIDNIFNQDQRTRQVDNALPGVRGQLNAQGERAEVYASGRVPDSVTDRALELGIRSNAADQAYSGGFGTGSSAARKISDLMSAEQRINLSQYGDQLLTGNIRTKADVLLAPTQYSTVGSQIKVTPEVGAGRAASQYFGEVNQNSIIPASTAFQSTVQQNQFDTGLEQNTRQFNATNQIGVDTFNATTENQFKMDEFGYNVAFAGSVAGAGQTAANTQIALDQQKQYADIYAQSLRDAQSSQEKQALIQGLVQVATIAASFYLGGPAAAAPGVIGAGTTGIGGLGGVNQPGGLGGIGGVGGGLGDIAEKIPGVSDVAGSIGLFQSTEIPQSEDIKTFTIDTGIEVPRDSGASLESGGAKILSGSGIYNSSVPGSVRSGIDLNGNPVYSSSNLLSSSDISLGQKNITQFKSIVAPLGVLTDNQTSKLDKAAFASQNPTLIKSLSVSHAEGDKKGFINTMLKALELPVTKSLSASGDKAGLHGAYGANQLFSNWGKMSPAQKGLGISNVALNSFNYSEGKEFGKKWIVEPSVEDGKVVTPGINVGKGLQLFSEGYNTYSLAGNFNQLYNLQKIASGSGDVDQTAKLAKNFSMLGIGTDGAAVAVDERELRAGGWSAAPNLGVGAITAGPRSKVPTGYKVLNQVSGNSGIVAIPLANAATAAITPGSASNLLGQSSGAPAIGAAAYTVYKGWKEGGTKGVIKGALGGSALAGGIASLGRTNSYLLGGVVASSLIGGVVKAGKNSSQKDRDSVRSRYQQVGITDKNHQIKLPDGSTADIGTEGGYHNVKNPDLLTSDQKDIKKLSAYDADYTNDLDYSAALGGIALSRIVAGGKETNVDQLGNQLGNASLGSIGFGANFNKENYAHVMQNQRAIYAKAGVGSKSDAYQLANQMYAEGRITESDLVSMQQSFNMVFDTSSYDIAQTLMAGRHRGIENTTPAEPSQTNFNVVGPSKVSNAQSIGVRQGFREREDVRRTNQQRYQVAA